MGATLKDNLQTLAQVLLGSIMVLLGLAGIAYSIFTTAEMVAWELLFFLIAGGLYAATGFDVRTFWGNVNGKIRGKK
jgi:hypothetical protein